LLPPSSGRSPDYTALQPRRQPSSYSVPWEPQISLIITLCSLTSDRTLLVLRKSHNSYHIAQTRKVQDVSKCILQLKHAIKHIVKSYNSSPWCTWYINWKRFYDCSVYLNMRASCCTQHIATFTRPVSKKFLCHLRTEGRESGPLLNVDLKFLWTWISDFVSMNQATHCAFSRTSAIFYCSNDSLVNLIRSAATCQKTTFSETVSCASRTVSVTYINMFCSMFKL
jgi:hypothetical protein